MSMSMTRNVVSSESMAQLVFVSAGRQLCVSVALAPIRLRRLVTHAISAQVGAVRPGILMAELFTRLVELSGPESAVEVSPISWGLPGVRVVAISDNQFSLSDLGLTPPTQSEMISLTPSLTDVLADSRWVEELGGSSTLALTCRSLSGDIGAGMMCSGETVREVIRDKLADPHLRHYPPALFGSVLATLAGVNGGLRELFLDPHPLDSPTRMIWLKHVSGGTYAYGEPTSPQADRWSILGDGFSSHQLQHHLVLRSTG
jgi:hypothetical protein